MNTPNRFTQWLIFLICDLFKVHDGVTCYKDTVGYYDGTKECGDRLIAMARGTGAVYWYRDFLMVQGIDNPIEAGDQVILHWKLELGPSKYTIIT